MLQKYLNKLKEISSFFYKSKVFNSIFIFKMYLTTKSFRKNICIIIVKKINI